MILKGLDLNKLSQLISLQVDQVTCLECCKYYIAPETAPCGHTLCHTCWKKRRTCPICAVQTDRRAMKLNLPLQSLTEKIHALVDAYEKLFKTKLDEFMLDTPGAFESENDPTKNVKEWLASSENQFSAPVVNSEQSSQEVNQIVNEKLSASKVQVHQVSTKKVNSPTKVVHVSLPQEDWDKIEPMPDFEDVKNKENIVGPMDIQPFSLEDNEYTMDNPRRSSRKRELKNNDSNPIHQELHISKDSNGETDKKSNKIKQNWGNVKRMRKEFSKLNKKNKNKLNVSIEMCKKTQNSSNKPNVITPVAVTQQIYDIDDNTPNIVHTAQNQLHDSVDKNNAPTPSPKVREQHIDNKVIDEPIFTTHNSQDKKTIEDTNIITDINIHKYAAHPKNNMSLSSSIKSIKDNDNLGDVTKTVRMPFFKKGALCPKYEEEKSNIETINHYIDSKSGTESTDDIEISIKIGNTMTNIFIKKKKNDVQLKVNTDREVQTTLGPQNLGIHNALSPKDVTVQNIEINIDNNGRDIIQVPVEDNHEKPKEKSIDPVINKSVSTKKNTASADTATAQFEITESVEKELSNIMECDDTGDQKTKIINSTKHVSQATQVHKNVTNLPCVISEEEHLNDLDIFESGSVKETNVQFLKTTKSTPSEILMPNTYIKSRTQKKNADKRERDVNDDDEMPKNKKMKVDVEKGSEQIKNNDTSMVNQEENKGHVDSEPVNYDVIMGQVFANIDADIEDIRRSQNTVKNTCSLKSSGTEIKNSEKHIQMKDTVSQSQKLKTVVEVSSPIKIDCTLDEKRHNQKDSENIFSFLEKDVSNCVLTTRNDEVAASVQQHIEDLLTPDVCRNLASSRECSLQPNEKDYDSDKSIVEETPQKNSSISKVKQKNNTPSKADIQSQKNNADRKTSATEKISLESAKLRSIINLTDTTESSHSKDVTVLDTVLKKHTLETPLNITKFVDHIKHKSTPVARKSLNFDDEAEEDEVDPEQTLCPTSEAVAKNTQEKEFLSKAFEKTPNTPAARRLAIRNIGLLENKKLCIAGSCLSTGELAKIKYLCSERKWTYVDKYTKDITHLVVGVDEENKSQRSVKYMCALAAGKWIVSYEWVERCIRTKKCVDEVLYEALDSTGDPGPKRSRIAKQKLFHGITFFCMPPFSVLDVETLKAMLEAADGRVVNDAKQVRVTEDTQRPAILLAEPENTQEDRFIYLAMELGIVPVNFEWVLNCLGSYTLSSIHELLLCPATLLPPATSRWPASIIARELDD